MKSVKSGGQGLAGLGLLMIFDPLMTATSSPNANPYLAPLLLAVCAGLIVLREVDLVVHPRLWAEEGTVFYKFASQNTVLSSVLTPQVGYLTLFNGFISVIQARFFSLEQVPVVSTIAAGMIQLLPVIIVLYSKSKLWDTLLKKILVCLGIVLLMPPELWLNSTNSHFVMGLIIFLVMMIPAEGLSQPGKWLFRCLLVLCNLTGPLSMLLTPVFVWRAWKGSGREKKIQAWIQLAAALVQAGAILYCLFYQNHYHRLEAAGGTHPFYRFIIDHFSMGIKVFGVQDAFHIGLVMAAVLVFVAMRKNRAGETRFLLAAFAIAAVFSSLGSLGMQGSPRYGYLSTFILFCVWLGEATAATATWWRAVTGAIVCFTMVSGLLYYRPGMKTVYSGKWPRWKNEVEKWRADPAHRLQLHPAHDDYWKLDLSATHKTVGQ